jgi:CBS domain-containing protein
MTNRKSPRGTAAVEYVLMVALIIGVALMSFSVLGEHASQAHATIGKLTTVSHSNSSGQESQRESVGESLAENGPASLGWTGYSLHLILPICLMAGIAFQAFLTFRRTRQPVAEAAKPAERQEHPLEQLFDKRQVMLKDLSHIIGGQHLSELTVGQVMSDNLTVVGRSTSIQEVEHILRTHRRHHILVTADDDSLAGIISDRDLSRRHGDCASEVMTSKITFATRDTELTVAATTMINQGISALPVMEEGKLVGILTTTDLTLVLQCILLLAKREQAHV